MLEAGRENSIALWWVWEHTLYGLAICGRGQGRGIGSKWCHRGQGVMPWD